MRISFHGKVVDEPRIRAGFIGCGSHSFRNVYPTFQFAPVELVATCDLDIDKARAFARQFGAERAYADHHEMLRSESLDAVFIVTGYDARGRPTYPDLAVDCLSAGCHVWMEKPPAATVEEIDRMDAAARAAGKQVMVGLKKMFFPANEKAAALAARPEFGPVRLATLQYPQYVPTVDEFARYLDGERLPRVTGFLDHLCHPMALLVYLMGMPSTLHYARAENGAGLATFTYDQGPHAGAIASLVLTQGAARNGGMERTMLAGERGAHIVVDNCHRVTYHRDPPPEPGTGYGSSPNFFTGAPEETTALWEPEFSLGQLYNKGLFLLGYYGEVNEFARAILEGRPVCKAHLEHARQVTRVFQAFAEGPGRVIPLD